jgi:carbon storage regulator CsrA
MLRLRRTVGERIVVIPPDSGPIRVTLIEVRGGQVWLGFEADSSTEVLREELYEAMVRDGDRPRVD